VSRFEGMFEGKFEGKRFVVTGATGAIGFAIARALVAAGAQMIATARDARRLQRVARELGGAATHAVDLTREDQVLALARVCGPPVDGVLHAAGSYEVATVRDASSATLAGLLASHVESTWNLARAFVSELAARQGEFVVIASSVRPGVGLGPYAAAKAAQTALVESLRAEVNPLGVRVLLVHPGRTAGTIQERLAAREGHAYHPERLLQPADIAAAILGAMALPRTAETTDLHLRPMLA
jgi:NADP-dependent 3-hydroxy acid dehydrogenase YdfG